MAKPNIIYILADDMGYGDMACNEPACRIPTPNLDRLAQGGMRFTDMHAGSAICTPSRYCILTGRYCWRSRLKQGIVWHYDGSLIEPDRLTVAELLRQNGYRTACLGKWHLGWDWATKDGSHPNDTLPFGVRCDDQRGAFEANIDFAKRIGGGPVDHGFDSYFGVDMPNFPPYTWFEDDHLTEPPSVPKPEEIYGYHGCMAPGWKLEAMIPEFTRRAVEMIEAAGREADRTPFFLYFPLTSPHSPIVPNAEFRGRSGIGAYGDFVCEVDWVVGQVADALERAGLADDTLLMFTSDNGPENRVRGDDEGAYARARRTRHFSMGGLRGIKWDAWEGGHRVPFVARCPGVIPAGAVCERPAGLVDLLATCAEMVQTALPADAGEDSVSMLPLLRGRDTPTRDCLIHHSGSGRFAIREGDWVFIDSPRGNDAEEPEWFMAERGYVAHDQPGELYHLGEDLAERRNRYADEPRIVARLSARLNRIREGHEPRLPLADERHLTE